MTPLARVRGAAFPVAAGAEARRVLDAVNAGTGWVGVAGADRQSLALRLVRAFGLIDDLAAGAALRRGTCCGSDGGELLPVARAHRKGSHLFAWDQRGDCCGDRVEFVKIGLDREGWARKLHR